MDEEKMSKVEKQETFKKMSKVEKQKTLEYASIVLNIILVKYQAKAVQLWVNDQNQKYQRIEILIKKLKKALNLIKLVIDSYEFCNDLDQDECMLGEKEGCQWDDKCSWNENPQQSIPEWADIKGDLMGYFGWDECETCGGTGGRGWMSKTRNASAGRRRRGMRRSGGERRDEWGRRRPEGPKKTIEKTGIKKMVFPALCPYPGCYHLKFATSKELRDHIEKVHEYRELPSIPMLQLAIDTKKWPVVGQKVEALWASDKKWYPAIMRYWNQGGITVEWLNSNEETSDISLDKISTTVREPRR